MGAASFNLSNLQYVQILSFYMYYRIKVWICLYLFYLTMLCHLHPLNGLEALEIRNCNLKFTLFISALWNSYLKIVLNLNMILSRSYYRTRIASFSSLSA
jgi:hypothetical protein